MRGAFHPLRADSGVLRYTAAMKEPSSERASFFSVIGCAIFLACSWTWCIGMWLPVLLWRDYGPGKNWPAIAARLARLAHEGSLDIDDPNLATRQFMALIYADLPTTTYLGDPPSDAELLTAATNAVRTFTRAYRPRREAAPAMD